MKVIQAMGPFYTKDGSISFNVPKSGAKYIKIGIQVPQAPHLLAIPRSSTPNFTAYIVRFMIDGKSFVINGNGILEFEDLSNTQVFSIQPLQDMDAYTIIDIAFIDDEESA